MHKARRIFIILLFFALVAVFAIGFYYKSQEGQEIIGNKLVGFALVGGFFVLMPLFIYHRWKDKNVHDYMLTKENILKMKEFNDSKER
ncbi:hypothetical protein [uncultured Dokdonia sp.]|uniref:hypothetical protein n=1 Tax=uncultured Dokdonia sp. TaxID=575653 RepID=UPI00260AFC24|nr:hypothetical protein [uncultured Dokdonia sp.]